MAEAMFWSIKKSKERKKPIPIAPAIAASGSLENSGSTKTGWLSTSNGSTVVDKNNVTYILLTLDLFYIITW